MYSCRSEIRELLVISNKITGVLFSCKIKCTNIQFMFLFYVCVLVYYLDMQISMRKYKDLIL